MLPDLAKISETTFVGREKELRRLHALLDEALSGHGRSCFVAGESGSGKTAVLQEFVRQAQQRHEEMVAVIGRCNAQTGMGEAYLPFMEILALLTGSQTQEKGAISERNATRLGNLARSSAKILVEYAPDIIGAFVPGASLVAMIGKSIAKDAGVLAKLDKAAKPEKTEPTAELDSQKIYRQYTDLLSNVCGQTPLIVILDDMHWADTASINLYSHLCAKLQECRVLLLGTYRPNDLAMGRGGERHPLVPVLNESKRVFGDIVIDMETIEQEERRRFVEALVDAEPNRLDEAFRLRLLLHTNGHPLFTVELLQSFKENGDLVMDSEGCWVQGRQLDWDVLPPRMEGVIEERIGRLEAGMRDILVAGSIQGQSFTAQVVAQLQKMSEREILKYLSQELEKRHRLVKEGNTEKIGKNWLSHFSFSHTLFQQYLYNDMSERERMILHGDVAGLLEAIYKDKRDSVLVQLARHYDIAGEAEKATACLVRAAALAIRISAYEEARTHLLRALELLNEWPEDAARARLELDIQLSLSVVYRATLGWDSPEVIKVYYRARKLCAGLNLQQELAPIIFGLWCSHLMRLELPAALGMAEQYLQLGEQTQDAGILLHAHFAIGNTCFWMGRIRQALEAMTEASRLCALGRDYLVQFGQDPGVLSLAFLGLCSWLLGRPDQAKEYEKQMLATSEGLSHHFTMAIALYGATTLDYHLQDHAAMKDHSERLVQLSREHQFPLYYGLGLVYRGWIAASEGKAQEGIRQMEEGFGQWISKHGGKVTHSLYCVMLAEALQRDGQRQKALDVLDRGLAVAQECSEHCYEPELHRLRAELLFEGAAAAEEVETAYRLAIDISRARQQTALVTRAAESFARFLRQTGRQPECAELAGPIARGAAT